MHCPPVGSKKNANAEVIDEIRITKKVVNGVIKSINAAFVTELTVNNGFALNPKYTYTRLNIMIYTANVDLFRNQQVDGGNTTA